MFLAFKVPKCLLGIFLTFLFFSGLTQAATLLMSTAGADVGNCQIAPCLTLTYTLSQASPGDTIIIAPGTYSKAVSPVVIPSTLTGLTIEGANADVDPCTGMRGAETVLDNTQGIEVDASDVTFNGLTITGQTLFFTGFGIWLNGPAGVTGTQIINNIFTNNAVGLGLANAGPSQALIQHNQFLNNNNAPSCNTAACGTGIYTDQFVGGLVTNVLINENCFTGNVNAGIAFSSSLTFRPASNLNVTNKTLDCFTRNVNAGIVSSSDNTTLPDSNIQVTNNTFDNNGRGMYFLNTRDTIITGNTITNSTPPADGGRSVGLAFFGADSNFTVSDNAFLNGARYGILIENIFAPANNNTNIEIHQNNIVGNAIAGMSVTNAPAGSNRYATCNWWGSATGPTNPLNPGGTGDVIEGEVVLENFSPFLIAPAPSECPPDVAKTFDPKTINIGGTTTPTITLHFEGGGTLTADFTDTLPVGLSLTTPNPSTDCGGVLDFDATSVTLPAGSTIPATGTCTITATVTGSIPGTYINTIPAEALEVDFQPSPFPATATLLVARLCP